MSPNPKDFVEQLGLIYYGLIALPLLLFPLVYLPIKDRVLSSSPQAGLYFAIGLILILVLFLGRRQFLKNLTSISRNWPWERKLSDYRRSSVIFYAIGLISSMFSIALLWLTNHLLFVAIYPILLLVMSIYRPTVERLKRELPLTEEELSMINDQRNKGNNIG